MQVTVKHQGEEVKVQLTAMQREALSDESYMDLEDARCVVGKQAKQVFKFLIEKGLFTATKSGGYKITALGRKVAAAVKSPSW